MGSLKGCQGLPHFGNNKLRATVLHTLKLSGVDDPNAYTEKE